MDDCRILWGSLTDVSRMLEGYFGAVMTMFQGYFRDVERQRQIKTVGDGCCEEILFKGF